MSAPWWRSQPEPQPAGALPEFLAESEVQDFYPPATRLRLPAWIAVGEAKAASAPGVPPAERRASPTGAFTIGTPVSRYGSVKLWRARSVNLRLLLFSSVPTTEADGPLPEAALPDAGPAAATPGGAGHAGGERRLSPEEILARRLAALLQPPAEILLFPVGPLEWPGSFFPYQRDGIRALLQSRHLLLGDEMGLGKTIQTIAALRLLFYRRECERALIVTPASLLEQWRREIDLWAPELRVMVVHGAPEDREWRWQYRAHVSLTSYETLRMDASGEAVRSARDPWSVVILDEAQRIKNRETDLARACKQLPRDRSWALTGTPLENRPEDLLSLLEFVTGRGVAPPRTTGVSLRARLSQVQLRRRKAAVLRDLPPKITTDLLLPLAPAQRREYERAEQTGIVALRAPGSRLAAPGPNREPGTRVEHVLALLTRLKQICNFAPASGASAKMEDLEGRIEELAAAGNKALVFTQFTDRGSGARRIAERLQRFSPLLYTGDMTPRERAATARRFREDADCPVLILSLQAGGQGLNLQCASYVFHFDRTWNPAVERQAEDRTHRLGQTQPVHVYRYIMAETIEERIDALLKSKTRLFEQIVEGSSLDPGRLLEQRDLYGLLGISPPGPPLPDPTGTSLEERVADLLAHRGYQVRRVGGRQDGGVDLVADSWDAVGTRMRLLIQCKETREPTGVEVVRSLNGILPPDDRNVTGVVVCPAGFTADARRFAAARHIDLWDDARLATLGEA